MLLYVCIFPCYGLFLAAFMLLITQNNNITSVVKYKVTSKQKVTIESPKLLSRWNKCNNALTTDHLGSRLCFIINSKYNVVNNCMSHKLNTIVNIIVISNVLKLVSRKVLSNANKENFDDKYTTIKIL